MGLDLKKYRGNCCGNSFLIIDCTTNDLTHDFKSNFAKNNIRKYEVDSVLFFYKYESHGVMEIYEQDGSQSDSCGNGLLLINYLIKKNKYKVITKGGPAFLEYDTVYLSLYMDMRLAVIEGVKNEENTIFVKIGEPHVISIDKTDSMENLFDFGKRMQNLYPGGVNVDIVNKITEKDYAIHTYERGVFNETLSCGTGSLSSFLALTYLKDQKFEGDLSFKSKGGVHIVSRHGNSLRLKTLKDNCEIELLM